MTVQLGNGDGTFGSGVSYQAAKIVRAIASADFNCDGNFDIALANYGGSLDCHKHYLPHHPTGVC